MQATAAGRSADPATALALIAHAVELDPNNARAHHELAELLRHFGHWDAALASYDRVISLQPDSPEAHCGRGSVLRKMGRDSAAVLSYEQAIALRPNFARAHSLRGNALTAMGEFAAARTSYDTALGIDPQYTDVYVSRAFVMRMLGNPDLALDDYDHALELNPHFPVAHNNRGNLLREMNRLSEALASYDRAIAIKPDYAEAHSNRGIVLQQLLRPDEAIVSFNRAVNVRTDLLGAIAEAHAGRAAAMLDAGKAEEALASCESAIAARPDLIGGYLNRGLALFLLGRRAESLQSYLEAIRLDSRYAPAHSDCALVLTELERPEEAVRSCDAAIALAPDLIGAHINRGTALKWAGRPREALDSFQIALRFSPDCAEAHWNAALCLLQLGEFGTGWQEHEWRKRMRQPLGARQLPHRAWLGEESLEGKTLFLHAEQGLGDSIQFCRYATLARSQGANVIMSVPAQLQQLMTSLDPAVRVITDEDAVPEADFHCAMLTMPLAMRTRLDTIPQAGRYLYPDPERALFWRERLGTQGLKVGIRWQGRSGIRADIGRSPPLATFAPLASIPGVRLISLQKGAGLEQLAGLAGTVPVEVVLDDDEGPASLMETAALLDALDLIITSDTSIAHLAGALERPTWVALKYAPDWRWLLDRSDSPWYRSLRLFRQPRAGDWGAVFASMRDAIVGG